MMNITLKHLAKWSAALLVSAALCFGYGATTSGKKPKQTSKTATSGKASKSKKAHVGSRRKRHTKKASWRRSQQKIDADRTRQIQEALIREHYLTGEPTGKWDEKSQAAMVRFQAANGWQTKVIPDSRALIKLGLGPSNDHLLNPESAMTSPLQPTSASEHVRPAAGTPSAASPVPAGGTAEPGSDPPKQQP